MSRWLRCVIVAAAVSAAGGGPALAETLSGGRPLAIAPVSQSGIFDPSLADTPKGARAWMSYSAVDPSQRWPRLKTRAVSTRLAWSDDRGATWTDLGAAVNPVSEPAEAGDQRTWISEVSSLVYDPGAADGARWKLFWHHYPVIEEDKRFRDGWIGYRQAAAPEALKDAPEIKLFGTRAYDPVNNTRLGKTGSPVGGPPAIDVGALGAPMRDCVALSEPGAMATAGGLYLAVGCYAARGGGIDASIVLLRCRVPCDPLKIEAWQVAGTVLSSEDARSFGGSHFSAADLFVADGRAWLIVSPVGTRPVRNAYQGCLVFRFADLDAGRLERAGGKPVAVKEIRGKPATFNGACTFAGEATAAGFLYGEVEFADRPIFRIFATGTGVR